MKKTFRIILALVLAALLLPTAAITASAEGESDGETVIYYFVDCGDYLPDTVSEGDQFGEYNTVTDQFFGEDPGTGKQWGVVDEAYDEAASTQYGDGRVCTTWTWAYEYNTAGTDVPKEESNRYCHNMTENGLDRVITYKFEMPEAGDYVVEVGFSLPWGNSTPVDFYLNGEPAYEFLMLDLGETYAYATVSPDADGFITVEAKSEAPTINMTYIIISNVLTNEETEGYEDDETEEPDPETEPSADNTTEAVTTAGSTTAASTDASTEKSESSGCGSALGTSAAAVVLTIGTVAVSFRRKRR